MLHRSFILFAALLAISCTQTDVSIYQNEETGLLTYSVEQDGFSIELIQLLPDFVRAIYGSHQFPAEEIEAIAAFCVFGTIVKNTAKHPVSYRIADWYFIADGKKHPVKTKSQWLEQWRKSGITFSWTLLPDSSDFEVGDWQQGFTTIDTARDKPFDLIYSWTINGKKYRATMNNIACAPETITEN